MTSHKQHPLWRFTDDQGSFRVEHPESLSRLYFPLANDAGILSSITPDLHGDIKTNHNSFLTFPVTTNDLHDSKSSRNFWLYFEGSGKVWSATGVSAEQNSRKFFENKPDTVTLDAGMLWHRVTRINESLGVKAEITNFAPVSGDTVEIMIVEITNIGQKKLKITPTSSIPIFARSADNLRDHYHVTTLLHRVMKHSAGVVVKPTMSFDERGHKINETVYAVIGTTAEGELPTGSFATVLNFIGEGGNFEAPKAVIDNLDPSHNGSTGYQGKPAVGALRFKTVNLAPRQKTSYVLMLGIANKESQLDEWLKKFGTLAKAETALKENIRVWSDRMNRTRFRTKDKNYNLWLRWVGLQPTFRRIFGNSFLPDFDYGRGGRGWRDLWQDCLALLLTTPSEVRPMLLHNYGGVRIDGSNATIIGSGGEFIADRNNITRVWMDHGVWPYHTTELYIHQTGDFDILFENVGYFRDRQQSRVREKDKQWNEAYGNQLKTKRGAVYSGSVLEHILTQHLVQFFNVGEHNHIRLENADWNDGLDMAYARGESVAFTSFYAWNLDRIASLLEEVAKRKNLKKVTIARELLILLDRVTGKKVSYLSVDLKTKRLNQYFEAVQPELSGVTVDVQIKKLVADLREKSRFVMENVRQKEWIQTRNGEGLFNGYYDNHGRRVEGDFPKGLRMTLAGQVYPVMTGVATTKQTEEIIKTVRHYLKDKAFGGYHLNTDFHEIRPDLGRAFSFAYGEKENGAFFSHMVVMYAHALYQRGFVQEAHEALDSIYRMSLRTEKSKIYPGIPEYFNCEGRGLYHYLTGSASWYVLTVLTQVFGVRGQWGDLLLAPKFAPRFFESSFEAAVDTQYADKKLTVLYKNPKKISYEHYSIGKVTMNGRDLKELELHKKEVLLKKELFLKYSRKTDNQLIVTLE